MIAWESVADPGDGFDGHGLFCSGRREAHTCDCGAPGWPVPGMSYAALLPEPEYGFPWFSLFPGYSERMAGWVFRAREVAYDAFQAELRARRAPYREDLWAMLGRNWADARMFGFGCFQ